MILRVGAYLGVYYPDKIDYYTSEGFVMVMEDAIKAQFPNLMVGEVEHAIKAGMQSYKYHTFPKINDLLDLVREYVKERIEWSEEVLHNEKESFKLNGVHESVLEIFKRAQREAAEELQQEQEALDKKARFQKAKDEADAYHKSQVANQLGKKGENFFDET